MSFYSHHDTKDIKNHSILKIMHILTRENIHIYILTHLDTYPRYNLGVWRVISTRSNSFTCNEYFRGSIYNVHDIALGIGYTADIGKKKNPGPYKIYILGEKKQFKKK